MIALKKRVISALVVACLLLSLSACTQASPQNGSSRQEAQDGSSSSEMGEEGVPSDEQQQKVLSYAVSAFPATLDAAAAMDSFDAEILYHTSESLVRLCQNEVQPGIAERWEISEDGTQYTFYLRDAVWEDGQPVTAEDFAYSFRRLLDPEIGTSLIGSLLSIRNALAYRAGNAEASELGIEVPDEKTLVLTLESEAPYFLELLAADTHAYPLRQDVVEAYGEDYGNSSGAYLSCGPFRLKSWEEDTITLEKNETYWDAGNIHLDQILCRLVPDGTTRALMFESGELNAYLEVLKSNETHYPEAQSTCGNTLVSVQMNMGNELLANDDFRLALSSAIDRQALVETVAIGGSEATNRFVSSGMPGETGRYIDAFPVNGVALSGDTAAAQASFNDALAALELSAADLPTLTFVCQDTAATVPVAEQLVTDWEAALGIEIQLEILPAEEAVSRCRDQDYDLYLQVSSGAYLDPYAQLSQWRSDAAYNWTGWADEDYDALLDASNTLENVSDRLSKLSECEQYLLDNGPQIPIYFRGYLYGTAGNVSGVSVSNVNAGLELLYADIE